MKSHKLVRNAISKELAEFVYAYLLNKRKVARHLYETKYISKFTEEWGVWDDGTVANTYSYYADLATETLLQKLKPLVESETGLQLHETYSYGRIYKKGDLLPKHADRELCEYSITMNLGGDEWPFYLELEPGNEIEVIMSAGDMLIYKGELRHWRLEFDGDVCCQIFLHYVDATREGIHQRKYDGRPFVGLPAWFGKNH